MTLHNQTQKEWAQDGFGVCECEKDSPRVIDGKGRAYYDEEQLFDLSIQNKCCEGGSDCALFTSYQKQQPLVRTTKAEIRNHIIMSVVGSIFTVGSVILITYSLSRVF